MKLGTGGHMIRVLISYRSSWRGRRVLSVLVDKDQRGAASNWKIDVTD